MKHKKRKSGYPLPQFLNFCRNLIVMWLIFFIAMVTLVFIKENNWIKIIFTVLCIIEIIFTAKIIPSAWNSLQSQEFKEKISKKLTWSIIGLILLNLIISSFFIIWRWAFSGETMKISFGIILFLGSAIVKTLFFLKYKNLNKHMKNMHIDCELVQEKNDVEITIEKQEPNLYLKNSKEFVKLENKKSKK